MKRILILPSFERSVKKLTRQDKKNLTESLEIFNLFLLSGELPAGFGFKKINHDKTDAREMWERPQGHGAFLAISLETGFIPVLKEDYLERFRWKKER